MVQAKTDLFDTELIRQANLFKVLSHPARLQILQFLAGCNCCITGDISEELPLGRTTVNQHLKELKEAGLIQGRVEGVKTNYCLDAEGIQKLSNTLNSFIQTIQVPKIQCK